MRDDGFETVKVAGPPDAGEVHVWRLYRPAGSKRGPLLALLARVLAVRPDTITLTEGEHGRPALAPPLAGAMQFNWSHSGECALVALAREVTPGVDVELVRTRASALDIAERFFTARESAWLRGLPADRQRLAFLELWTAREAVLKATGRGIAFGLDRLAFDVGPAGARLTHLDGDDASAWQVRAIPVDETVVATLAWRGPPLRVRCFTLAE